MQHFRISAVNIFRGQGVFLSNKGIDKRKVLAVFLGKFVCGLFYSVCCRG